MCIQQHKAENYSYSYLKQVHLVQCSKFLENQRRCQTRKTPSNCVCMRIHLSTLTVSLPPDAPAQKSRPPHKAMITLLHNLLGIAAVLAKGGI